MTQTTANLEDLPERPRRAVRFAAEVSEWVADVLDRHPDLLAELAESGRLETPQSADDFDDLGHQLLDDCGSRDALFRQLRRCRTRESLRIAVRDLGGLADLQETLNDLTGLADALIGAALARLTREHEARWGTPRDGEGRPLSLLVIGMGKLGGGELNFSSDVDLVLAYRASGQTDGERPVDTERFFGRLARDLVRALSEVTEDGYCYRTDLRLRPHGDAGRLVLSFPAMEEYFQREGREWERYAWVKARPVAGEPEDGEALLRLMRPFVYRRYLDYAALEALRGLKAQVAAEVRRRQLEADIKLGAGGIREIEFIAQVFQLIRGGRDPALRDRQLLRTLDRLAERRLITGAAASELADAYHYLRRLENRLQMYRDEQTHRLPEEREQRARLSRAMGEPSWETLADKLAKHRRRVHGHFEAVFEEPGSRQKPSQDVATTLWQGTLDDDASRDHLRSLGFGEPEPALERLRAFREGTRVRSLGARGRERLDRVMPPLLATVTRAPQPDVALPRVLQVLEAIVRRSVYLALLHENPPVIERLCQLCGESGWVAEQLARTPLLLDELIEARRGELEQDWEATHAELKRATSAVLGDDPEQVLEAIAQFKRARTLQIALAELSGDLDAAEVGRQLSGLARAVLVRTLSLALGTMSSAALSERELPGRFAVIAYGRLGAGELAYDSDLDLVFLYDGDGESELAQFFMRLTRRLIHLLTTPMASGRLYPVDTRLRPNGKAGLLVSPLRAYHEYQTEQAWTWEQQALVRARCVYGNQDLAAAFENTRYAVLCRPRDREKLRLDIAEMRRRMRREHRAGPEDLKQGEGGLVDLEFIVQFETLASANEHPRLCRRTGTLALLEGLGDARIIEPGEAASLAGAYEALLARLHRLTLEAGDSDPDTGPHRKTVSAAWRRRFEGAS